MSLCFPCAAFELRHRLDLALLTNQNGRYFYKMHLATLYMAQLPFVVFSQLGEVVRHSGLYEFYSCALCREVSHQGRKKGASLRRTPNHWGGAEKSQQCRKFFLQSNTFTSKIPKVQIWRRRTCFLPRAQSNLGTHLCHTVDSSQKSYLWCLHLS